MLSYRNRLNKQVKHFLSKRINLRTELWVKAIIYRKQVIKMRRLAKRNREKMLHIQKKWKTLHSWKMKKRVQKDLSTM